MCHGVPARVKPCLETQTRSGDHCTRPNILISKRTRTWLGSRVRARARVRGRGRVRVRVGVRAKHAHLEAYAHRCAQVDAALQQRRIEEAKQ